MAQIVLWTLYVAGEEEYSYGYGGTGKASTECKFSDYGEKFANGDVITAYLVRDDVMFLIFINVHKLGCNLYGCCQKTVKEFKKERGIILSTIAQLIAPWCTHEQKKTSFLICI